MAPEELVDLTDPEQLEKHLIDAINAANALQLTINTEGWEIIENSFESIESDALEQLGAQQPGNDKAILAAHAVWYSVKNAYLNVRRAVISAIKEGEQATITLAELHASKTETKDEDWL